MNRELTYVIKVELLHKHFFFKFQSLKNICMFKIKAKSFQRRMGHGTALTSSFRCKTSNTGWCIAWCVCLLFTPQLLGGYTKYILLYTLVNVFVR